MKIFFPFSFSIVFWSIIGIFRYYTEHLFNKRKKFSSKILKQEREKVAACIPAHNEEDIIEEAIHSAERAVPSNQIYVVSDGSTDQTAQIALKYKCNVLVIMKGRGKAKALKELIIKFHLLKKFRYILFLDADTRLDPNYIERALKHMYYNPKTAVLTSHANPHWRKETVFSIADFISAYRTRLYKILQIAFMYGMTWKYTNVNVVIPGFAAFFRTSVLSKLEIDTKGIWIEDFNLAFQVHKKKLGNIAYQPNISATYKDPNNFEDYWNQVRRWNVGFFQTVRKHGIWLSFFWISLSAFMAELLFFAIFLLAIPIPLFMFFISLIGLIPLEDNPIFNLIFPMGYIYALEVLVTLLVFDYILTILIAIREKKYRMMVYGLLFVFFQFLNSLILISSLKPGFFDKTEGKWSHAKR